MLKGLFYHFSPGKDIGHGVRLFRLAESLQASAKNNIELALLRDADAVYPPPSAWKHGPFIPLAPGAAGHGLKRQTTILSALRGFKPDFMVTAFFPFGRTGCAGELLPALRKAKNSGVKLYSAVPAPYFSHSGKDLRGLFQAAELYDRIFIHSPLQPDLKYMAAAVPFEKRISAGQFLEVFEKLGSKLCFTGYVLPRRVPAARGTGNGRFILVHRGGGSTSPDVITCAILAKELVKNKLPMTVVAGPASSAAEMRSWRALIERRGIKGVTLSKKTGDLFGLLARSAVSAGTAGSTVYEALYLNKRTVLIPYKGAPGAEHSDQLARAAMLGDAAGAIVLDYDRLSPAVLAAALDKALARPAPAYRPAPGAFDGAGVFARTVLSDLDYV